MNNDLVDMIMNDIYRMIGKVSAGLSVKEDLACIEDMLQTAVDSSDSDPVDLKVVSEELEPEEDSYPSIEEIAQNKLDTWSKQVPEWYNTWWCTPYKDTSKAKKKPFGYVRGLITTSSDRNGISFKLKVGNTVDFRKLVVKENPDNESVVIDPRLKGPSDVHAFLWHVASHPGLFEWVDGNQVPKGHVVGSEGCSRTSADVAIMIEHDKDLDELVLVARKGNYDSSPKYFFRFEEKKNQEERVHA